MMNDLGSYLDESRRLTDKALDKYLPGANRDPKIIHKAMRYSVFSGGKRIRPVIVLEACKACAPRSRARYDNCMKDALVMACAVEMVHAYSLIHDDLPSMDDDDYRRGKPTCHKVFGEANAILAGDALLTFAFNLLARHLRTEKGIEAIKELSEAIGTYGMVGGQVMDIVSKAKGAGRSAQEKINKLKTARLFEASAKLGAIAAGGSRRDIQAMAAFGGAIGKAFQIIDDIMDGEGTCGVSGKRDAARCAREATASAKRALKRFARGADRMKEIADMMLKRVT